jgi:hypothetical protein
MGNLRFFAATILYFRARLAWNGTAAPTVGNRDSIDLFRNRSPGRTRVAAANSRFARARSYCGGPFNYWFMDARCWRGRCSYAIVGSLFGTLLKTHKSLSPCFPAALGHCTRDARAWSLVDRRPLVRKKTLDSLTETPPISLRNPAYQSPLCPSTTKE